MKVRKVQLHNVRLIKDMELSLNDKRVTILLGENGKGKTTLLDSIALCANVFTSTFPGIKKRNPSPWDIHINEQNEVSDYLSIRTTFSFDENHTIEVERFLRRDSLVKASSSVGEKELRDYALSQLEQIQQENGTIQLPIFVYYSTERGRIQAPQRNRNFQKVFERWDSYINATEADMDFKRFFQWFDYQEDMERREKVEREDYQYESPTLKAVRNALHSMLNGRYRNPRILLSPLRFAMDEQMGQDCRTVRIEQMSDGYRIIVALVADIASRLAEANPQLENPLLGEGIVLIDEADLHLHPSWQRRFLKDLSNTFPNIHFITTTHSPLIAMGAADIAQIFVFNGEGYLEETDADMYSTYDVGQVLMSELFNLPTDRSPKWDEAIRRRFELLKKQELSAAEKLELQELEAQLSKLAFGESTEEIEARQLILEAAGLLKGHHD